MEAGPSIENLTPPDMTSNAPTVKKTKNKKDDKSFDQLMKSLNTISDVEEKLSTVCKKYVEVADENKKLRFTNRQSDKRHVLLTKEKEQLQHDLNKIILVKSKLENLCRELQKQNKAIKEESLLKIREEEERRVEMQAKFQSKLSEITSLLQQNNDKNAKLRNDNISMSEKFKGILQQFQLREDQVDKMAKQMSLESQLADAKLMQSEAEKSALQETVNEYRDKIFMLLETEAALRSQLKIYTEKYEEIQNSFSKSNQAFHGFKEQMEMMSKKLLTIETESLSWKKRWETSQTTIMNLCEERQGNQETIAATTRQLHHMQSLCRTLQAERTSLFNCLKENNIECPPTPAVVPAPPPPPVLPASNSKVDAMVANCAQLKQSLAHLQTQINVLTEKKKKSKSKKNNNEKQSEKSDLDKSVVPESKSDATAKDVANDSQSSAEVSAVGDEINETNGIEASLEISTDIEKETYDSNADEKLNNTLNADEKLNDTLNADEKLNNTLKADETLNDTLNADVKLNNTLKADETLNDTLNADEKLNDTLNADEKLNDKLVVTSIE